MEGSPGIALWKLGEVAGQSLGQPVWIGQRNEVTAGDLIRVKAESVFGDAPLEVGRKLSVIHGE